MCRLKHVSTEIVITVCLCMRQPDEYNMQTEQINSALHHRHILFTQPVILLSAIRFSFCNWLLTDPIQCLSVSTLIINKY